jgi:pimeloyl-ACP methyl ester carboxylesterase
MRTIARLMTVVLIGAGGAAVAAGTPAAAAQPPGYVLSSTSVTPPGQLAALATGKRIQYVTTGVTGAGISATGLVLTPKTNKKHKVVVWGHGTTGLADQCAPSNNPGVFWEEARAAVAELLARGWTVAAPDYPGLGTPQPHPYLVGVSEARSMIDSVRAARNLDASLGTQYVIDGHSQGGQGALFANQMAPAYDGTLVLRGTASIAPVSGIELLAELIPGTPGQGYLVMGLYGLNAVEPGFNPIAVLGTPAEQRLPVLQTGCLNEILAAYAGLTAGQLLTGGELPASWVNKLVQYDEPAQTPPTTPVMIVQGTADEAVPAFLTDALRAKLAGQGAQLTYLEIAGGTHDSAVTDSRVQVADWIALRFQ